MLRSYVKRIPKEFYPVLFVCLVFLISYLVLGLVRHSHFLSGYDLSVVNQVTWEYSRFILPIMTAHAYAFQPVFYDHVEFIYALLSPFYWVLPDARSLIITQVFVVVASGFAVYLLARKHKINQFLSLSLLISYFMFYGVQNALWNDVHSVVFGISFLSIFVYFLDTKRLKLSLLFFILAIISKEDIAFIAFFISFVYLIRTKEKINVLLMVISVLYSFFTFYVFFPYFTWGYQYANENGILSNLDLVNFINTSEKRSVFFYSFLSTGFLSLLNPFYLIPFLADIGHYFVLGNERVTSAQGIFGHYRFAGSLLLIFPIIFTIEKFKKLNSKYLAIYVLFFACLTTYLLHSPLTYLTKKWFWTKPSGVENIKLIIRELPPEAKIVTQVNISPHVSNRKYVITMWGERRNFVENSPCSSSSCAWFKWAGTPEFLLVDTSEEWNITHLLANREDFIEGLENMEKEGIIKKYKEKGFAKIYKVEKRPF